MNDDSLKRLPGAEIVLPGIADLEAGRESVNASAVQAAAPRLRRAGLDVSDAAGDPPAAHVLYRQLSEELGDGAHSRYNAILSRVIDFCVAAERARGFARINDRSDGVRFPGRVKRNENTPAEVAEAVRVKRLREDAKRPISVNLAEGIALSHQLMRFTGVARRS